MVSHLQATFQGLGGSKGCRVLKEGGGHACASEETSGMETWACCLVGSPSAAPAPATAADSTALICWMAASEPLGSATST